MLRRSGWMDGFIHSLIHSFKIIEVGSIGVRYGPGRSAFGTDHRNEKRRALRGRALPTATREHRIAAPRSLERDCTALRYPLGWSIDLNFNIHTNGDDHKNKNDNKDSVDASVCVR
uniref:Uncharacterized protein n=1 Tax=Pseudo-nitzschia australis TaxID=44445 RepID=A0A7S4AV50_9STRA|mmetsp:Transcript_24376/g.53369  ORF Transcript_24376/g.53369 Transcript_24376/m.53369 type:complete len:116 (-) Transcript_24376:35-382(-)